MPAATLTGPAAVGKTSIMKRLLREIPGSRLVRSTTTRAPRSNDEPGEYQCLPENEFRDLVTKEAFAWVTSFADKLYGTLKTDLRLALASDKLHFAAIVPSTIPILHEFASVEGLATCVRSIYIKSPGSDILLRRLVEDRGEPKDVALRKIEECASWDKIAFNTLGHGRSPYLFVGDRDDFEEKYLSVLKYVQRPW
jgi:guanylate kinase